MTFKLEPYQRLLGAQILAHLAIIPMVVWGTSQDFLISLGVYFLTGCLGMNMTYHRLLSHRSWNAPKWFEHLGSLLGTLGLTGSTIAWCAIHREHHRTTDTPKDPHSPHYQKWWEVQFLSMRHPVNVRFVTDLLRDPFQIFLHRHYFKINFAYAAILLAIDPFLMISAYLFPAAVLWNAGSAVNSIGHLFGYKNHDAKDESRNNLALGYLVWGEGWHNNHHRYPKRYYLGERWFEIDISGLMIHLVRKRESVSKTDIEAS